MSPDRRASWLERVTHEIVQRLRLKFMAGQVKYKCDIGVMSDQSLINNLEQEIDDAQMYLAEMKRRYEARQLEMLDELVTYWEGTNGKPPVSQSLKQNHHNTLMLEDLVARIKRAKSLQ